eukprot:6213886-Pleurochrysis_carterae.AAC.2
MPFNSRPKSATSAKKMRMDVALAVAVKRTFRNISGYIRGSEAAEDLASFASFEGAVVVELVGEAPFDSADERVLWTLDQGGRGCPCGSWVEVGRQKR